MSQSVKGEKVPPAWHARMMALSSSGRKKGTSLDTSGEDENLMELFEMQKEIESRRHVSFGTIPRFWPTRKSQKLARVLRRAAKERCESEALVLTWDELEYIRVALNALGNDSINYERLCETRRELCQGYERKNRVHILKAHLSGRRFLQVSRDAKGRAMARDIYNRIDRATCAAKTRTALQRYDASSKGFLREQDLERYISDLIPDMPAAHTMDVNFHVFYVFTAVRRFFFFLDPKRRGYIRIDDAATSSVAIDLLDIFTTADDEELDSAIATQMHTNTHTLSTHEPNGTLSPTAADHSLSGLEKLAALATGNQVQPNQESITAETSQAPAVLPIAIAAPSHPLHRFNSQRSWFYPESAKAVYAEYLELDIDQNGMLSKSEFLHFRGPRGDTRLTATFVDRVFAEIITYPTENPPHSGQFHAEMDFKTYLDVVLAFDNIDQPQALLYFWRILDLEKNGRLDPFTIKFFFRDIAQRLYAEGFDSPSTDDVVDEIFDMVKPDCPAYITLDDLANSRQAHIIILMLVDVAGFLAYDNREHLMQGGPDMEEDF